MNGGDGQGRGAALEELDAETVASHRLQRRESNPLVLGKQPSAYRLASLEYGTQIVKEQPPACAVGRWSVRESNPSGQKATGLQPVPSP